MLIGDFGVSYTYQVPVELVSARLIVSLPLAMMACCFHSDRHSCRYVWPRVAASCRCWDHGVTQLGIAIPNFWFAMLLVMVFAIHLRWVSAGGFRGGKPV